MADLATAARMCVVSRARVSAVVELLEMSVSEVEKLLGLQPKDK